MFKPVVKAVKKKDTSNTLFKALDDLKKRDVLVGIPQFDTSRAGESVNNAELAFLHTEGSPANNIPARPFLQPSIKAHIADIAELQKRIIKAALAGKADLAFRNQEKLGLFAQIQAQNWFTDSRNGWPPNSKYTILLKGSDKPLIDTGSLRKSITYAVIDDKI